MNIKKIKDILHNKKIVISCGLALSIMVAGIGVAYANNVQAKKTENKKIEALKEKKEDAKAKEKKQKLEVQELLAKLKAVDTTNLSDVDKAVLTEKINSIEELINKKEYAKAKEEISVAAKFSGENILAEEAKKEENTEDVSKEIEEVANNTTDKPNTSGGSNVGTTDTSSGNSSNSGNTNTSNSKPSNNTQKLSHSHNWSEVYKEVYHQEVGHYESVVVKEGRTESQPVYEERVLSICNGCGLDITGNTTGHIKEQALAGNYACGGHHTDVRQIQTGTTTINHPAEYENKWVVDKAAWSETVTTGHSCSCGATK